MRAFWSAYTARMSFLCCCCSKHLPAGDLEQQLVTGTDDGPQSLSVFAAMWCRSSYDFALECTCEQIGARKQKTFCWVRRAASSEGSSVSSWFSWFGGGTPRLVLSVNVCSVGLHDKYHLERALALSASNPALVPILASDFPRPDRAVVVRQWSAAGSLRDVLHGASPHLSLHAKYDRVGTPLSEAKCVSFACALLDTLLVIRPLGARACLHVHCGNIFLDEADGHTPRLAEWEQGLLGQPSHLADIVNDLQRALEPAAVLALCLYEVATGFELDGLPAVFPPHCS